MYVDKRCFRHVSIMIEHTKEEDEQHDLAHRCRRCQRPYRLGNYGPATAACPFCGAPATHAVSQIRWNGVAASLAIAAAVVLAVAVFVPIMSISKLGQQNVFSLLGGVLDLYGHGHLLLGSIIFVFSILFPLAKLAMVLGATSRLLPLGPAARHRLHVIAAATGKYSLLDVLVIAILVVLLKLGDMVEVHVRAGTYLFCLAIVLSIVASLCVDNDTKTSHADEGSDK